MIRYSPEKVFNVVADVESYPEFVPWCVSARDVSDSWEIERVFSAEKCEKCDKWDNVRYLEMSAGFRLIHDHYVSKVCTKGQQIVKVRLTCRSN